MLTNGRLRNVSADLFGTFGVNSTLLRCLVRVELANTTKEVCETLVLEAKISAGQQLSSSTLLASPASKPTNAAETASEAACGCVYRLILSGNANSVPVASCCQKASGLRASSNPTAASLAAGRDIAFGFAAGAQLRALCNAASEGQHAPGGADNGGSQDPPEGIGLRGPAGSASVDGGAGKGESTSGTDSAVGSGGGGGGVPLASIQPRVVMVFTCAKCETRSTKSFSKLSYTKGVVLVRCPGCQKLHLIADHLGWFGEEPFVLHEFLAEQGQNVIRVTADDPRVAPESLPGATAPSPTASPAGGFVGQGVGSRADPGLAARAAAAAAAAVVSEGGVFELSSFSQVQGALDAARRLDQERRQPRRQRDGDQQPSSE